MHKQYILFIVLITCFMRAIGVLADESIASYLSAEEKLTLLKVLTSKDTFLEGPFILDRTGSKLILRPGFQIKQILIDPKVVDTSTWPSTDLGLTFLDIPEVEIMRPGATLYYHTVLDFIPRDPGSPIALTIKSLYLTRAVIEGTGGEGNSNNSEAEFDLIMPTLTITNNTLSLDALLQIRDMSNEYGQGRLNFTMPYDIKDGNSFTYKGKAGTLMLFPGAENESLNDPIVTFNVDKNNILSSVLVTATHNDPPFVQGMTVIMPLPQLDEPDLLQTVGGPSGFKW